MTHRCMHTNLWTGESILLRLLASQRQPKQPNERTRGDVADPTFPSGSERETPGGQARSVSVKRRPSARDAFLKLKPSPGDRTDSENCGVILRVQGVTNDNTFGRALVGQEMHLVPKGPEPMRLYNSIELTGQSLQDTNLFADQDEVICACDLREL